jgi:actin related protein 2/3 complex subunit 1A/1B
MSAALKRLAPAISCHAWNKDGSRVALCPNDNEIHIYKKDGVNFTLEHKLVEHDQLVTGIDWGHSSDRIVSCSQDRNAYVWTFQAKENKWKPTLVILRINRAATHVKWSPKENKFAVACGAKCVAVCFFEEDQDWWVSKHIKKHKSTVTKLDWHPNNVLLATASTDFKARVFSAFIKGVDKEQPDTPFGKVTTFGDVLLELDSSVGWVQSVQWSPAGTKLAFIGHDSSFNVADVSGGKGNVETVKYPDLPFRDLLWVSEDSIVAVGHDCTPVLFQSKGGWKFVKKIDEGKAAASSANNASARQIFQSKVDKGEDSLVETTLNTKHQNCITWIAAYKKNGNAVAQYSTSGVDGNLAIWDAKF